MIASPWLPLIPSLDEPCLPFCSFLCSLSGWPQASCLFVTQQTSYPWMIADPLSLQIYTMLTVRKHVSFFIDPKRLLLFLFPSLQHPLTKPWLLLLRRPFHYCEITSQGQVFSSENPISGPCRSTKTAISKSEGRRDVSHPTYTSGSARAQPLALTLMWH